MIPAFLDERDPLQRQNAKLLKMTHALMRRVEKATDDSGEAYAHFQRSLALEEQVRGRTRDLEQTLDLLNRSNARLSQAMSEAEHARADLHDALESVREGFALFDADDVLVMSNSRFGQALPDVAERLGPGLRFVDYVRFVANSSHLVLPEGQSPDMWARERMVHHQRLSATFNLQTDRGRWVQVSEQRTPGGGTAILQTDITELIQIERQERDKLLDEQARLIRATLDHINQGICIFDRDRRLVGWNARLRSILSPPMQLLRVGTTFQTLLDHFQRSLDLDDLSEADRFVRWVGLSEPRRPLAMELRTRDGVFLDVFGQEMPDRGFVISFTDVTAEREANIAMHAVNESLEQRVFERTVALEDALSSAERANASKSRFVAAASHDLLQPLSAAKLFIASLESALEGTETAATVEQVRSAFDSVESILGALLDISKLDSGVAAVTLSTFPIGPLMTRLGNEFTGHAPQKGIDLKVVPSSAIVRSDAAYLRRIIQNLLSNAIRYTQSGRVLLGARRRGSSVRIEVWDTGPGIADADRGEIFKEFQRLKATQGATNGMGLGLAIVERACVLLDHPLDLVSEEGLGSCFRVLVPISDMAPGFGDEVPSASEAKPDEAAGLIALVIENDAAMRAAMATLLDGWGMSPLEAASGSEAVKLLEDLDMAPDVVLADYQLDDGETGFDALSQVRARFGSIPAVIVTADRGEDVAERCRADGLPLLKKPVEPARLRALLASVASV